MKNDKNKSYSVIQPPLPSVRQFIPKKIFWGSLKSAPPPTPFFMDLPDYFRWFTVFQPLTIQILFSLLPLLYGLLDPPPFLGFLYCAGILHMMDLNFQWCLHQLSFVFCGYQLSFVRVIVPVFIELVNNKKLWRSTIYSWYQILVILKTLFICNNLTIACGHNWK